MHLLPVVFIACLLASPLASAGDIGTITHENLVDVERGQVECKMIGDGGVPHPKLTEHVTVELASGTKVVFKHSYNNYLYYRECDEALNDWAYLIRNFMELFIRIQSREITTEVVDLGHGNRKLLCYLDSIRYFQEPNSDLVAHHSVGKLYIPCP